MQQVQSNPTLDYGATARVNLRRVFCWSLGLVAILCVAVIAILIGWNWLAHYEENGVRADLETIPGAHVLKVATYEDKPMYATVSLDSTQSKTITFYSPWRGELRSGTRMSIQEIGSNDVLVYFRDENWSQGGLDFGRNSPLANVLPFRFHDVRDLAAHYDEVEAYLREQPTGIFTDTSGNVCRYKIEFRPK
jgi:hypothetical protein